MLISPAIIPQLSPAASKIYLALLSLIDPYSPLPSAHAPIQTLIRITALSERSCHYALRQLKDLQLIRLSQSRRYHTPNTYFLLPPPDMDTPATLQPIAPPSATNPQPAASLPQTTLQSIAAPTSNPQPIAPLPTPDLQPVAPQPAPSPVSHAKNPNPQSLAGLLNQLLHSASPSAGQALPPIPKNLSALLDQCLKTESALAAARASLPTQSPRPEYAP